jgi:pSer/pThr/pTyr-binding forkhead associated (FHA) protein
MNAKLINVGPGGVKQEITLDRFPTVIGRGAGADIRIDDRWLSRRHCQIEKVSATLVVRDLGSKNGTLVNRLHVSEEILMPGDKLTIGTGTFVVLYEHRSETLTAVSELAEGELVGFDEGDNTATFNEDS